MKVQTKIFMPKFFKRIYHKLGERCWKQLTHSFAFADLQPLAITCIVVTVTLLGVRHLGWLQPLELNAFDLMVQLRTDPGPDPRLLIVEITEQDINDFKKWPLSDGVLAKAIAEIAQHAADRDPLRGLGQAVEAGRGRAGGAGPAGPAAWWRRRGPPRWRRGPSSVRSRADPTS